MGRVTNRCIAILLRSFTNKKSLLAGKVLHGFIVRTGQFADTNLFNRLLYLYVECNNHDYARRLFDKMLVKDSYSWNALLANSCRNRNWKEAYQLFDEMPERDVVSWNNLISALARNGFEEKALILFEMMISEGFLPTRFTLASVLTACGKILNSGTGKRCHGISVKIGLHTNIYVGNALLSMYARCGLMADDGVRVFEDLSEPNEVSFTAIIGGLAREKRVLEAVRMFKLMCEKGAQVDSICLSNILRVFAQREYGECDLYDDQTEVSDNVMGKQIHTFAFKLGLLGDLHLNNSLLDVYAKNRDMDGAEMIFAELPELNVVSWNIMIAGFGKKHQSNKSVEYLERMKDYGFKPDEVTCVNVLGACFKFRDIETGHKIFNSMSCRSISAWNAMLSGYSKCENHGEAVKLFRQMQFQNLKPDRITLAVILASCTRLRFLEGGKQIHAVSLKTKLLTDNGTASGLIGVYSECEKIEMAEYIFAHITELDTVCWNSMIAGLARNSLDTEALMLFKKMHWVGVFPTNVSYAIILSSCSRLSSSLHGRQVHGQIVKNGYANELFTGTALTNMYCKFGEIDSAQQFFKTMLRKNTVLWNQMIHGYAQNGRGDEAMCLYRDMISSGEKPDGRTFVSVLTACSHSGLVDLGLEIFNSMWREHEVEPELVHYICIIDCLGRAGRFEEAEMLVENMPHKDHPIIWEVLLSSCRTHENVSLAKRVADKLISLDPQNSAPYVLLTNTYTSLREWDEATALQGLMNKNCIVKSPGSSWIINSDHGVPDVSRIPLSKISHEVALVNRR